MKKEKTFDDIIDCNKTKERMIYLSLIEMDPINGKGWLRDNSNLKKNKRTLQ